MATRQTPSASLRHTSTWRTRVVDVGSAGRPLVQIAVPYDQATFPLPSMWSELIVADAIGFIERASSSSSAPAL